MSRTCVTAKTLAECATECCYATRNAARTVQMSLKEGEFVNKIRFEAPCNSSLGRNIAVRHSAEMSSGAARDGVAGVGWENSQPALPSAGTPSHQSRGLEHQPVHSPTCQARLP